MVWDEAGERPESGLMVNVQDFRFYFRNNGKPAENAMLGFAFHED